MVDVTKKQASRLKFLNALYDLANGESDNYVESLEVGRSVGIIDLNEVESIMHYLADEGLLDVKGFGGDDGPPLGLTHHGLVEIEQARANPKQRTEHFPAMINVINVQNMHGSQIQQGTTSSTQIQVNKTVNVEAPIREIITRIEQSTATEDQKEIARGYGEILVSQSKLPSESRNSDLIKKTWEKLSNLSTVLSLADYAMKAAPIVTTFFGF